MDQVAHSPFGALLRAWRGRRRLSQLGLALAADMSQRHVSFIESGRTNPSRATVNRLGEALGMPWGDRERLFLAAGFAIPRADNKWDKEARRAVDESLAFILARHEPYPAMVVDRLWNVKSANAAAIRFLIQLQGEPEPNVIKALLDPKCLRPKLINWREAASKLVGLVELEVARCLSDPEGERLLQEILALPEIRDLQPSATDAIAPALALHFRLDRVELRLFSLIATIGMSADSALEGMKLETLLPADEATKAWFARQLETVQ